MSIIVESMDGSSTRGGMHYPALFDPEVSLTLVNRLFETKPKMGTNRLDQEVLDRIGYERSYFSRDDSASVEYEDAFSDAVDFFNDKCRQIGKLVQKPFITIVEYQPDSFMLPHTDKGSSNPLFTVSGSGLFETFELDNETTSQITKGEYPDTAMTSQPIYPGDAFLSYSNILHGFRNGPEPRVVVGLLDGTIS